MKGLKMEELDGPEWLSVFNVSTGKSKEYEWFNNVWVEVERHGPGEAQKAFENGKYSHRFPPPD